MDNVKEVMPVGFPYQAGDRPVGDLLLIPWRFAMAMQDDGWHLRMALIWDKNWVTPDPVEDRTTLTYDVILVFCKQRSYDWNKDAIRVPSVRPDTTTVGHKAGSARRKPFRTSGIAKDGLIRRDDQRNSPVPINPLGRNAGSVWRLNHGNYQGKHTASLPPRLAQWILEATCYDDNASVLCPFGGAGTFAMVAAQMGHRATSIDINAHYTIEALDRCKNAPATLSETDDEEFVEPVVILEQANDH